MLEMSGFKLVGSGSADFTLKFSEQSGQLQVLTYLVDGEFDKGRSFAYRNMSFQNASNRTYVADEIISR